MRFFHEVKNLYGTNFDEIKERKYIIDFEVIDHCVDCFYRQVKVVPDCNGLKYSSHVEQPQ